MKFPPVPADLPDPLADWAQDFATALNQGLDEVELAVFNQVSCALTTISEGLSKEALAQAAYEQIVATAYAGIEYKDITVRVTGTASIVAVSAFMNIEGGVMMSPTNGTQGIVGNLNVLGVPLGKVNAFVSYFDEFGNPTYSICGEILLEFGPVKLGRSAFTMDCPGCTDKVIESFQDLGTYLAQDYVLSILYQLDPALADDSLSTAQLLSALSDDQKQDFFSLMVSSPPALASGGATQAYQRFLVSIVDSVIPRMAACSTFAPEIFGFDLSGGTPISSDVFYAGPKNPEDASEGLEMVAYSQFSPFNRVVGAIPTGGALLTFLPPPDSATLGVRANLPSYGTLLDEVFSGLPVEEQLARNFERFSQNLVMTSSYELSPFGMTLGVVASRIIPPSFDQHPLNPNFAYQPPQVRNPDLPDRIDILQASIKGPNDEIFLADINWTGREDDFMALFAELNPHYEEIEAANLELQDDYFPHGGFLGAAFMSWPRFIVEGVSADDLRTLFSNNGQTFIERKDAAGSIFNQFTQTREVGHLSWYFPFPNPPSAALADGSFPASITELWEELSTLDLSDEANRDQLLDIYPSELMFIEGKVDTSLLGIPLQEGRIRLDPDLGLFEIEALNQPDSWFSKLTGGGSSTCTFTITVVQEPAVDVATDILDRMERNEITAAEAMEEMGARAPKVSFYKELDTVHIPDPFYNALLDEDQTLNDADEILFTIYNFEIFGYSPFYDPDAETSTPLGRAQRDGGFGVSGRLSFNRYGLSIDSGQTSFAILPLEPDPVLGIPGIQAQIDDASVRFDDPALTQLLPTFDTLSVDLSLLTTERTFAFSAEFDQKSYGAFFTVVPVTGDTIPIKFAAALEQEQSGLDFAIGPARLSSAFFAPDMILTLHGDSFEDPFTLCTCPDWTASATIERPGFVLQDRDSDETLVSITAPDGASFSSGITVRGDEDGLQSIEIAALPTNVVIDLFPEREDDALFNKSFTIGTDGTASLEISESGDFEVELTLSDTFEIFGVSCDAGSSIKVSESGFRVEGTASTIPLGALGSIEPLTAGEPLGFILEGSSQGIDFLIQPARIDLDGLPLELAIQIMGDETGEAFSISTYKEWNATVELTELGLQATYGNAPTLFKVQPAVSGATLTSTTLSGDGFNSIEFEASFDGDVDFTLFEATDAEATLSNLALGNGAVAYSNLDGFTLSFSAAEGSLAAGSSLAVDLGTIPSVGTVGKGDDTMGPLLEVDGGSFDFAYSDGSFSLSYDSPELSLLDGKIDGITTNLQSLSLSASREGTLGLEFTIENPVNLFGNQLKLSSGTHAASGNLSASGASGGFNASLALNTGVEFSGGSAQSVGSALRGRNH